MVLGDFRVARDPGAISLATSRGWHDLRFAIEVLDVDRVGSAIPLNRVTIRAKRCQKGISSPMLSFHAFLRQFKVSYVLGFAALFLLPTGLRSANAQEGRTRRQSQEPQSG